MKNKIIFGIIGCGMVAEYHIQNLLKINLVEIKWICDNSGVALHAIKTKYNIPHGANDYKEILKDPTVNAVIICTPPISHYNIAIDAIRENKHLLIEKPIAIRHYELRKLYAEAKKHPDLIIIDCSARHSRLQPKYFFLKKMIESGKLGKIYCIHHNSVQRNARPGIEYNPNAKWFYEKKFSGGGPLIDWGVYDLSFHLGLLDDRPNLTSVRSFNINGLDVLSRANKKFDVEEHGIVAMKFNTNLIYYWERASNAHNEVPNETRIYGTRGGLKFNYLTWDSNEVLYYYSDQNGVSHKESFHINMNGHHSHIDDFYALDVHFINCVLRKEKPILSLSLSVKHLKIIFKSISAATLRK